MYHIYHPESKQDKETTQLFEQWKFNIKNCYSNPVRMKTGLVVRSKSKEHGGRADVRSSHYLWGLKRYPRKSSHPSKLRSRCVRAGWLGREFMWCHTSGGASLVAQQWRISLQCRSCRRCGFDLWVGKMPWRRA